MLIGNIEVDPQSLADVCRRHGIAELSVFGSRARGDGAPDSDLDLLFVLRPGAHLGWRIEQVNEDLEALSGQHVDLVSKRTVHPLIREEFLESARVVCAA